MIFGAFKRSLTVELAAYVVYATAAVVVALLLPGITPIPDWLVLILMIGVQLWLYKRFYGRL
jgi:hypothetical protein